MKKGIYDFVVVGAGVVGLSAAMYGARLGMKTLVLGCSKSSELGIGGVITTTNVVENYPGFEKISGRELAQKIRKHAESYELVEIKEEEVLKIEKRNGFSVKTAGGEYFGKTILFASGTKWKKLDVGGSKRFENKGVSYCALCDAPLYKGKTVAVVGGSDSAIKDALLIAEHAKKVYIIYRGEKIHPEKVNLERVESNKKIEVINKTNVAEIRGKEFVESIVLDRVYRGSKELKVEGIFVAIGHVALSDLAKTLGVETNEKGEIIINHKTSETNVAGVYAAGDVADKLFKQAITGVGEGCTAAYSAYHHLENK